jgi:2-polyprenyl-3-methyl-5-hydroxy-6-metoxy-1,4-benzoquinol methylase
MAHVETDDSQLAAATSLPSYASASAAPDQTEPLPAMAHEAIYDTVIQVLREIPRGTLLDVPAGAGALAARLLAAGFDVQCCDLYPELFRLRGIEIRGGDLAGRLPYDDETFAAVVCVEGLEHLENPQHAIREFARLLKRGGHLVVSVPNILNIEERLKWLLFGYTSHFKPLSREQLARELKDFADQPEATLHINPIGYSELRYSLEKSGFELAAVHRDRVKSNLWLYWPMVAVIRLLRLLTPASKRRERWSAELQSDEVLLGGNTLIAHAIKR